MIRAALKLLSLATVAVALICFFAPHAVGASVIAIVCWLIFKSVVLIFASIAFAAILFGSALGLLIPEKWPRVFCGVAAVFALSGCMICMRSLAHLIVA